MESVAAAGALIKEVINILKSLPFLEDNETHQKCLNTVQEAWSGIGAVADALFETKDFFSVLLAAEANPASAVQGRSGRI